MPETWVSCSPISLVQRLRSVKSAFRPSRKKPLQELTLRASILPGALSDTMRRILCIVFVCLTCTYLIWYKIFEFCSSGEACQPPDPPPPGFMCRSSTAPTFFVGLLASLSNSKFPQEPLDLQSLGLNSGQPASKTPHLPTFATS